MAAPDADPDPSLGRIRLIGISSAPLDVTAVYGAVQAQSAGAVALFVGVVRDHDGGKAVTGLAYSAHPSADAVLHEVVQGVIGDQPVEAVAAVHRTGDLAIGDAAVVVAVASRHRDLAFRVCHQLIDEIKARVPIWKHQVFTDGSDEWVGTPR